MMVQPPYAFALRIAFLSIKVLTLKDMIQVQVKFDYSLKTLMKWPNFHFASSGKRTLKLLSM